MCKIPRAGSRLLQQRGENPISFRFLKGVDLALFSSQVGSFTFHSRSVGPDVPHQEPYVIISAAAAGF